MKDVAHWREYDDDVGRSHIDYLKHDLQMHTLVSVLVDCSSASGARNLRIISRNITILHKQRADAEHFPAGISGKEPVMFKKVITAAVAVAALGTTVAYAANAPIVVTGLAFRHFEAEMARDPLVAQNSAINGEHITPHAEIAYDEDRLNHVIPAGTPVGVAEATLRQIGAQCQPQSGAQDLRCTYFDVQPRSDEYVDGVHWNTDLKVNDGLVQHVALQREWTRR
jgi:hypothetical protein